MQPLAEFKNIPYSLPVARFEPAQLWSEPWINVLDGREDGLACVSRIRRQPGLDHDNFGDDCLHLEVHTPLPLLVDIQSVGGFPCRHPLRRRSLLCVRLALWVHEALLVLSLLSCLLPTSSEHQASVGGAPLFCRRPSLRVSGQTMMTHGGWLECWHRADENARAASDVLQPVLVYLHGGHLEWETPHDLLLGNYSAATGQVRHRCVEPLAWVEKSARVLTTKPITLCGHHHLRTFPSRFFSSPFSHTVAKPSHQLGTSAKGPGTGLERTGLLHHVMAFFSLCGSRRWRFLYTGAWARSAFCLCESSARRVARAGSMASTT